MGGSAPVPARVRVKICGVTRPEDAAVAVTAGASFLGVVFAGGPRRIDAERARAVVAAAADVPVIGVFDDRPVDEILATAREVGLRGVQLHGGSDAETARRLRRAGLMVLRVARLAGRADLERLDRLVDAADAVVVEPRVPGRLGGTGVALDLGLAREARRRLAGAAMVLAGGLTPETVAAAVAAVAPDAVDVSSGVEQIPGIKDPSRVTRFVEAVRGRPTPA